MAYRYLREILEYNGNNIHMKIQFKYILYAVIECWRYFQENGQKLHKFHMTGKYRANEIPHGHSLDWVSRVYNTSGFVRKNK